MINLKISMETSAIVALSFGLFILSVIFVITILTNSKNNTNENVYLIKKWVLITSILLLNIAGCVLVYYTQNLQVILYLLIVLKSKDILMSVMFVFNMIYRRITKKYYDIPSSELTDEIERIMALVPVFNESYEQVCKTVDSILNSKSSPNYVLPVIISDGKNNYTSVLDNIEVTKDYTYKSWNGIDINLSVTYGTRNNKHIMSVTKYKNMGKKDSLIFLYDMFNHHSSILDSSNLFLKNELNKDLLVNFGVNQFDYVFCTDGDTFVDENAILCLVDTMKKQKTIACAGIVNVDKSCGNLFWNNLQNYQYMYSQYIRRTNEDLFGQVLCLPGCISMVKICKELVDVLKLYSTIPNEKNLLETNVQYIGTDRRFTSSIIYKNNDVKILQDTRAHAYTLPPQSFNEYLCQRKRWTHNTFFNSILNIVGSNVNLLLRFFNLIDVLRMCLIYFRLFNTLYFVYLLASSYKPSNVLDLVPYIVLLSYPVTCFLVYSLFNSHLRTQFLSLVFMSILNKLFTFFTNIITFTTMLFNIGTFKWTLK